MKTRFWRNSDLPVAAIVLALAGFAHLAWPAHFSLVLCKTLLSLYGLAIAGSALEALL